MTAPTVYHYHPRTGEHMGASPADPSPLEEGVWLDPANSTRVPPPQTGAGQVAVFDGQQWHVIADHRGETWWKDGKPFAVTELGDPAAEGAIPEGPPTPGPKQVVLWEDDGWVVKSDFRGEIWYRGHDDPVIVTDLGDPGLLGWTIDNPPPPPLERQLTKRQVARAMILGASITDPDAFIEQAITAIADPVVEALARTDWRYAPYFVRSHELFSNAELLAATGMTDEQIDALWLLAAEQPA